MHILIIPSWYPDRPGDVNGSFFREQAIALARTDNKVGLIYPNLRSLRTLVRTSTEPSGVIFENDDGVLTYRLQTFNWSPRLPVGIHLQWLRQGLKLFEAYVAKQGIPDVIHAHSMLFAGALATAIKLKYRIPVVVTEHSSRYAQDDLNNYELKCARAIAHGADENLAVSHNLAALLTNQFTGAGETWHAVPNIIHKSFLDYPIQRRDSTRNFSFVNVALLNPIKRHANLIRAFAAAFKFDTAVSLTIAGDGPERNALQALVKELQLEDRVILFGKVTRDRVPELLARSDAFVLSSSYETFGVVVAEALAMGVPVISTACGGPNSIVSNTDGMLVAVDNIEQLSSAMIEIRNRIDDFDPERIRADCLTRYGEESIVSHLISIYSELIAKE